MFRFRRSPRRFFLLFLLSLSVGAGSVLGVLSLSRHLHPLPPSSPVVSAGLSFLSEGAAVRTAGEENRMLPLPASLFEESLQLPHLTALTVTELPAAAAGVLMLGNTPLSVGSVVAKEAMDYFCFLPREGVKETSFRVLPAGCGYDIPCHLSFEGKGTAPHTAPTAVFTYASLPYGDTLSAFDREGDALTFEVCRYPKHGTLSLAPDGHYRYTPAAGFTGKDSFTYRAGDERGAFSPETAVHLTVRAGGTPLYADVAESPVQSGALLLREQGLLGGEVRCGLSYFHPEAPMTRGLFAGMLYRMLGEKAEAAPTGYKDEGDIPAHLLPAVSKLKAAGYRGEEESFLPNEPLTRGDAAQLAAALLPLDSPLYLRTVADFQAIGAAHADALYALYEGGYLLLNEKGELAPAAAFTRGDTATFLARVFLTLP